MKYINVFIFAILVLVSCGNKNKEGIEFFGKTIRVDYPKHIDVLNNGRIINLEGEYTGSMNAYDGMLMFKSHKHTDGIAYLYDVETGKRISAILKHGQGPDEVINFHFNDNFEKDSNGLHLWVSALNNRKLIQVNTQGEFVNVINTAKFESTNGFGIGHFFTLNDSLFIAYMQGAEVVEDGKDFIAPAWRIFNSKTGEIVRICDKFYSDYTLDVTASEILLMFPEFYLFSPSRIKPDKSKLAMAMIHLKRLNIFDVESGEVKSMETKDAPDLNFISLGKPVHRYYEDLFCDDDYIYVIESTIVERTSANAAYWYETLTKPSGRVLVYDWKGNFTNILQVKEDVENFAFDPVRKTLYSKTDDETVRAYDLSFLYK